MASERFSCNHQQPHEPSKLSSSTLKERFTQFNSSIEELKSSIEKVQKTLYQLVSVLPPNASSLPHPAESSESRSLCLCFKGELPDSLLTKNNIEDEGASLTVELYNDLGEKVEDGPESSLKVKIVVLDGDFEEEERNDWTEEDFERHVASPRHDKGPLLKGNYKVSLSGGCASVCDISFTDNSKSMRNGKFRLGAQVVTGLASGRVVRPAVSKPFKVKENRLKADRKHATPSLEDDLWRLVNINKTGPVYRRAVEHKVCSVKDFLQLYHTDEKKMQKILGVNGKKWEEIVKNAEACKSTDHYNYGYYDVASGDYLILDCAFKIKMVTFKDRTCRLYESLDFSQKKEVGKLRQAAYEKRGELVILDAATNQIPVPSGLAYPSSIQQEEQQQQQPAPTPPSMDPNIGQNWACPDVASVLSDQMCSNPPTRMQNHDTTAYEQRGELVILDAATNQIPVPSGLSYPSSIQQEEQEQQQPASTPPSMGPNVGQKWACPDVASVLSDQQNHDTTAADPEYWQQMNCTTSPCLTADAYGGNNTSIAYEDGTQQAGDYWQDLMMMLSPTEILSAAYSADMQNFDALPENQGEIDNCIAEMRLSPIPISYHEDTQALSGSDKSENKSSRNWCVFRVVKLVISLRRNVLISYRPQKKQKL